MRVHLFRMTFKRTRHHDTHITTEDIEQLRQLIDLGLSQKTTHRRDSRIFSRRDKSARHIGTVLTSLPGGDILRVKMNIRVGRSLVLRTRSITPRNILREIMKLRAEEPSST